MDIFKGQDNDVLKEMCAKRVFQVVIDTHNLTSKFQPLDASFNKVAKSFISEKYNTWMANEVSN